MEVTRLVKRMQRDWQAVKGNPEVIGPRKVCNAVGDSPI